MDTSTWGTGAVLRPAKVLPSLSFLLPPTPPVCFALLNLWTGSDDEPRTIRVIASAVARCLTLLQEGNFQDLWAEAAIAQVPTLHHTLQENGHVFRPLCGKP